MKQSKADNIAQGMMSATDYEQDLKKEKNGQNKIYPLTDIEGETPAYKGVGKKMGAEDDEIRQIENFANQGRREEVNKGSDFMS
jgi:cyanate lyase